MPVTGLYSCSSMGIIIIEELIQYSLCIYTLYTPNNTAQPRVTIEFTDVEFREVEREGKIDVTLSATGTSPIALGLVITPFTFDEYRMLFGRPLPDEIASHFQQIGIGRAECEPQIFQQMINETCTMKLVILTLFPSIPHAW